MTDDKQAKGPSVPDPDVIEVFGSIPLIEVYFRRYLNDVPAELRPTFREHRLTARHGAILAQLSVVGAISVGELAQRLVLALPTVSELVADLRHAGMVESEPDPDNRRRTLVSLAPEARVPVEALVAARSAPLLRALDSLSSRDRRGFAAGLAAWARELEHW